MTYFKKILFIIAIFLIFDLFIGLILQNKYYNFRKIKSYLRGDIITEYISQVYLNYTNNPKFTNESLDIKINNWGIRNSRTISHNKDSNTYRILFLGGSTTFGEVPTQNTFVSLIENKLNQEFKTTNFECLNAGLGFATSAEILIQYLLKWKYLHADLIIIHTGINDAIMMNNIEGYTYQPDYHTIKISMPDPPKSNYKTKIISYSNILTYIYIILFMNKFLEINERENEFININSNNIWLDSGNTLKYNTNYNSFYNNIFELSNSIKNNNSKIILVSEVFDTIKKFPISYLSPQEIIRNNIFLKKISNQLDLPFCNLPLENFHSNVYLENDAIHLNAAGEKIKSDIIYPYIKDAFLDVYKK